MTPDRDAPEAPSTKADKNRRPLLSGGGWSLLILLALAIATMQGLQLWKLLRGEEWEYTVVSPRDAALAAELTVLGSNGWEVVSARRAVSGTGDAATAAYELILKRPATRKALAEATSVVQLVDSIELAAKEAQAAERRVAAENAARNAERAAANAERVADSIENRRLRYASTDSTLPWVSLVLGRYYYPNSRTCPAVGQVKNRSILRYFESEEAAEAYGRVRGSVNCPDRLGMIAEAVDQRG